MQGFETKEYSRSILLLYQGSYYRLSLSFFPDDEEPILGQWITETLATASSPVTTAGSRRMNRRRAGKAPEENDDAMDLDADERGAMAGRSGRNEVE